MNHSERALLRVVDERLEEAARRAGEHLLCRPGCTDCCHEVFPINALDARRLRRGLSALALDDPETAEGIRRRAEETLDAWQERPPTSETEIDRFIETWNGRRPCPVLDPVSGRCSLYEHRPMICRIHGPPLRFGDEKIPPCDLCFQGCKEEEIDACRVEPDPEDQESDLLIEIGVEDTWIVLALLP